MIYLETYANIEEVDHQQNKPLVKCFLKLKERNN